MIDTGDNPAHWLTIAEAAAKNSLSPARLERLLRAFNVGKKPLEYVHPDRRDKYYILAFSGAEEHHSVFSVYEGLNRRGQSDTAIAERASDTMTGLRVFAYEYKRRTGRRIDPLQKLRSDIIELFDRYGSDVPQNLLQSAHAFAETEIPEYWQAQTERLLDGRAPSNLGREEYLAVVDHALALCNAGRPRTPIALEDFLQCAASDYRWLTGRQRLDWSRNPVPRGPFIDFLRALYDIGGIVPTYRMLRAPKT